MYETFEQAKAVAPPNKPLGYDNAELANEYKLKLNLNMGTSDYPILYHLSQYFSAQHDMCTVLDFGGNVGIHYLKFRRYLDLSRVSWFVWDVPAIIKIGRETCSTSSNVLFINDIDEFREGRLDVFLARGSIQYSQTDIFKRIIGRGIRPRCILIDVLSLYDGPTFVTLQNGGIVYYPEYIFNKDMYLKSISDLEYKLVDFWDCEKPYSIPFHRDRVLHPVGFCFVDCRLK